MNRRNFLMTAAGAAALPLRNEAAHAAPAEKLRISIMAYSFHGLLE